MHALGGAALLALVALALVVWWAIGELGQLQDESHHRATEAGEFHSFKHDGAEMYRVIADAFINRNFEDNAKQWKAISLEVDQHMARAQQVVDTDEEKKRTAAAASTLAELRRLFEADYLPGIKEGRPDAQLRALDEKVDELITQFAVQMTWVADSTAAEAKLADEKFDQRVTQLRMAVTAIVLLAGLVLVSFAAWVGRSVVREMGVEPAQAAAWAQRIAQGSLEQRSQSPAVAPGSVAHALGEMSASLESIVRQVRLNAESLAGASGEIASGNLDLSNRTESQASSLQQTTASVAHLSETVDRNVRDAHQVSSDMADAVVQATEGGHAVQDLVKSMEAISSVSKRIAEITGLIDGIAFQTNILALNAAVEAARAGEQGRGFAVVASEVRTLAQRSAEAAKEIKSLTSTNEDCVQQGNQQVELAGTRMKAIVATIEQVSQRVQAISRASADQGRSIAEVSQAIAHVDAGTQQNAALVEESAAATNQLRQQADELVTLVSRFKLGAA
jgi:methyl-accepting chemotaxis protein